MAVDLNIALANALLTAFAAEFPAGSLLQFRTGAAPGADSAASGTLLCEVTSPVTPWAAPASGSMAKSGTWQGLAVAAGVIGHYRFKNAAGTRIEDGSVTVTGGGGDLTVDTATINAIGQTVIVGSFTKTV